MGKRWVLGRVCAEVEASLAQAIRSGPIRFVGVGRYGTYWTLSFRTALEALIVLADRVVLLPASGGLPGDPGCGWADERSRSESLLLRRRILTRSRIGPEGRIGPEVGSGPRAGSGPKRIGPEGRIDPDWCYPRYEGPDPQNPTN